MISFSVRNEPIRVGESSLKTLMKWSLSAAVKNVISLEALDVESNILWTAFVEALKSSGCSLDSGFRM